MPIPGCVFVRHEANLPSGRNVSEIEIETFLRQGGLHPEHQALLRLIEQHRGQTRDAHRTG